MGKLEEMARLTRGNARESLGEGRTTLATDLPPVEQPGHLRGVGRLRGASEIPVDRIIADSNQPRQEFDPEAISRLADSLRSRGQLQPIRVRWDEAVDRYVVVVGERRWRAAVSAGLKAMACVIVAPDATADDILEDQLVENCLREDLRPIEQARAFRLLMDRLELSQRALAAKLNISQAQVLQALRLLDLPRTVQEQVEQGSLSPATAYEIAKAAPEAQETLATAAVAKRMTRADVGHAVARRAGKGRGVARVKPERSRVFRTAIGRVTVDLRKGASLEAFRAIVADVLGMIEEEMGGN